MPQYIDFEKVSSDPNLLDTPIHNGKLPTAFLEVMGVRIDGEQVTFLQEDFVERLHRSLVDGPKLVNSEGEGFDCISFALLMCGVDLVKLTGGREFKASTETDYDFDFSGEDTSQRLPVAIGVWPRIYDEPYYFHTAIPAHTSDHAKYIHKLGDGGPICLSSLGDVQRIVNGRLAAIIPSMTVTVDNEEVAQWRQS